MTFEEAAVWAMHTAASGQYGERASWGLYTDNEEDALAMTIFLGGPFGYTHDDDRKKGHRSHYHTANRKIWGISTPKFHIWYGEEAV